MEGPAIGLHLIACTHQRRVGVKGAISYCRGDANEILHHDAASAEIEVTDLAITHLSFGQTHTEAGCFEQAARSTRPQRVPGGGVGKRDRVSFSLGAVAPAIEYYQRDWPRSLCARHYIT